MQNGDEANNSGKQATADEVIASTSKGSFRTGIQASGHRLVADEPEGAGGDNAGPSPYDLLAAALATCTSMTLQMYAARKGLDLRTVTVRVRHGRMHARDCEDCQSEEGRIHEFRRTIELDGDLDDETTARLVEIAGKCPVHKTLEGEIKVRTELAG